MSYRFSIGKITNHPEHGEFTITFVGEEYVGVQFENGQHALFRKESFSREPPEVEPDDNLSEAKSRPWPENTFVPEPSDAKHYLGSRWTPFFGDSYEIFERIPSIISESQPLVAFGDHHEAPRKPASSWPRGTHLVWPAQRQGLIFTVDEKQLVSLYPYRSEGAQANLILDQVHVWEGGLEAQIDATWGGAAISFFDTAFLSNRAWYEAGDEHDFILSGIAYCARKPTTNEMEVSPNPDIVAWRQGLEEKHGMPKQELTSKISLEGMAMFIPIPELDRDDYSFRGPIKKVEDAEEMLGQAGWRLRVTVMRSLEDDRDLDLDILVTHRAWESEGLPREGDDIEGELWLQGRLWYSNEWIESV